MLLRLMARAQVQGRDDLAETFCKRVGRIETRANEELALIWERQRESTETLVEAFAVCTGDNYLALVWHF